MEGISGNARSTLNMLGYWLREKRDGWKGGMRIVEAGLNRQNARRWRIEGRPEEALERANFDLEAERRREKKELMRSYGENVDFSANKSKK